jgi:hypothetical protein
MNIEFFYLKIEKYFFKDRSDRPENGNIVFSDSLLVECGETNFSRAQTLPVINQQKNPLKKIYFKHFFLTNPLTKKVCSVILLCGIF